MANQYKNKIIYGNQTLMDITDTTATENDVLEGEVFYSASGARSVGLLGDATQSAHGLMSATDKTKLDGFLSASNYLTSHQDISGKANSADLATVATTGSYADLLNKPDLSQYLTSVPTMTGATSSANGTAGLIPAPTSADAEKFFRGDGTWQDGGRPMVILSYGNSVWNDFITAYNNNVIVYCRASSNSNPATGSQTRMAFMAYVNNATTPTEVEFQYYRSMSSHSATAMGDEVYVYKLTSAGVWSVTVRKASIKEIAVASGSKLGVSWSSDKVTLSNTMTANDMPMSSSDATTTKAAIDTLSSKIIYTNGTYAGLTWKLSGINNMVYFTINGTTNAAIAQWAFFNIGITINGHEAIQVNGTQESTFQFNTNGDIKFTRAITSGAAINAVFILLPSPVIRLFLSEVELEQNHSLKYV